MYTCSGRPLELNLQGGVHLKASKKLLGRTPGFRCSDVCGGLEAGATLKRIWELKKKRTAPVISKHENMQDGPVLFSRRRCASGSGQTASKSCAQMHKQRALPRAGTQQRGFVYAIHTTSTHAGTEDKNARDHDSTVSQRRGTRPKCDGMPRRRMHMYPLMRGRRAYHTSCLTLADTDFNDAG